ncbi:MAG: CvpA family protein [Chloroflexi bacterium]|nr:CvpA family protein [Chloroflexota bacterium]
MISLHAVFWLALFFFAAVGAIRGWVREILVTSSLVLAFVIITLFLRAREPQIQPNEAALPPAMTWHFVVPPTVGNPRTEVLIRAGLLVLFAIIGYETAGMGRFAARLGTTRTQDRILGAVLGALNGYFLVGSLWYYLAAYGYPFEVFEPPSAYGLNEPTLLQYMPPAYILKPLFGAGVASSFVLMLVLFIFLLIALL